MKRALAVFAVLLIAASTFGAAGTEAGDGGARVAATPSATATPGTQFLTNDWRLIEGPGTPDGQIVSHTCADRLHCWTFLANGDFPYNAHLLATSNGGDTWFNVASGRYRGSINDPVAGIGYLGHLAFFDALHGVSDYGITADGGKTWTPHRFDPPYSGAQIQFADVHNGYACVDSTKTYRTADAGQTWQRVAVECPPGLTRFLSAEVGWAPQGRSLLYSADGWKTRADVQVGTEAEELTRPAFLDFKRGWVGATSYTSTTFNRQAVSASIYQTVDGGATWLKHELPSSYFSVIYVEFVSERLGWASAYTKDTRPSLALLRTDDGGITWRPEIVVPDRGMDPGLNAGLLYFVDLSYGWATIGHCGIVGCFYKLYRHAPGLALTPTTTPTPASTPLPTTPTPTRTPFAPFIPGSATPTPVPTPGRPIACNWAGDWDTTANGQAFAMTLAQQGERVTGAYGGDRRLDGMAGGFALTGRWSAPPTFAEPNNAGRFAFTATADCQSFSGTWGFDASTTGGGAWAGRRSQARELMVRDVFLTVLGRAPSAAESAQWAANPTDRPALEAALRATPEGQRVEAVRALYRDLLLRDPLGADNPGLRYWVDSPLTLDGMRAAWQDQPEVQRVLAIRALYRELLGRDDDLTGIRYWASSPLTLDEIRAGFMASDEYRRRQGG